MIPLSNTGWQQYKPEGIDDLAFLAQENVPVYVQVNISRHLVYCYLQVPLAPQQVDESDAAGHDRPFVEPADIDSLPVKRFCNDVLYLQLSPESYEQAAHSRTAVTPTFSGGGLSRKRVYTNTGKDGRGREIREYSDVRIHDLERVEFKSAILIDAQAWSDALDCRRDHMLRGEGDPGMEPPEFYSVSLDKVPVAELYVDAQDVERLKAKVLKRQGHGNYPFDHKERMPGIYLMFQAAWLLNEKKEPIDPKKWLTSEAAKLGFKFRDKSIVTAAKFVRLDLDRAHGSGDRGLLQTSGLAGWDEGAKYTFPFASGWLSFVFALADWWGIQSQTEPSPPLVDLAKKLLRANFAGHEVGHLTLLISGESLQSTDVPELRSFVRALRRRWRPVIGIDKRRKNARER
ncbi:hypothetical protein [Pseudoxanthomonas wuyuanensis]|nr:hypothetical protein [Pseudoxanthomonas wuyuanensis]KAF1720165.1 hypothetical protein CSC75_12485 [Pseudoxanthomonas wuyuanensis]